MITSSTEPKYLRLVWGSIAFLIYFLLIGLLLFYFNHRDEEKPKHFVKKDEKRIQVTSTVPIEAIKVKTIVEKPTTKKPIIEKPKVVQQPKQVVKPKIEPVKKNVVIKEKVVKKKPIKKVEKKKDLNTTKPKKVKVNKPKEKKKIEKPKKVMKPVKQEKPKKIEPKEPKKVIKTSDLFSSVKVKKSDVEKEVKKKIDIQTKPISASEKINNSMKEQKKSDAGIENAYFAKVQTLLETWPAQSDYAGERATVNLFVKPSGLFEFKVKSQSDNVDFNLGLIDFLMQLQKAGLGKHDAGKTYEFKVEFIAKE
ncbi:MAG: Unknown protein [uncultured Sulfurovum sp.]|uniref:Uncharacterized protein n=1 Tax=uncultured Sulfurovum sp. TaxID=269237 RepID=A0A6S6S9M4_9BACT|nr:MAG: Unknown protein [uncultured Sulfurovum sp.]